MEPLTINLDDLRAAMRVVREVAYPTPTVPSFGTDDGELWLKLENLQRLGSFKIRGVWYRLRRMAPEARSRGVVTYSAGNFGLALAWAATRLGVPSRVIVSEGANPYLLERIRAEGAAIETMPVGDIMRVLEEGGRPPGPEAYLNPIGDPDVIAGAGTIALEFLEAVPDVRTVLVPVGGGDLAAGVAVAVKARRPDAKVFGVQAEGAAPLPTALRTGRRHQIEGPPRTIAGTIAVPVILDAMAAFLARHLDGCLLVSDTDLKGAMGRLVRDAKVIAEPSGAAAFAAWTKHRRDVEPPVVAIVSGGNVDSKLLAEIL